MPLSLALPLDWRPWQWGEHRFASPRHEGKADKPLIDVARPISPTSPLYWIRKWGSAPGVTLPKSAAHWFMMEEEVPYSYTFSTWDCCFYTWGVMNCAFYNIYIGRKASGQSNPLNPRTAWAHRVAFTATYARIQAVWLFAVCGGFYGYEFMYTHVPGLRIPDPSPEGWKSGYGNSTFMARSLAVIAVTGPGWYIWKGTRKGMFGATMINLFGQNLYEGTRCYVAKPSDRSLYTQCYHEALKQERHGQFIPDMRANVYDPDNQKPQWVYSYENLRFLHSEHMEVVYEEKNHEMQPLNKYSTLMPNPWFDWQKAGTHLNRKDKIYCKSELFKLPAVMSPAMQSGALDAVMA